MAIDDDDITVRGCITRGATRSPDAPSMLVWSRSDIMLEAARALDAPRAVGASGVAGRVFYWLDDDDDLSRHVGRMVEVKGDLEDFEKGEIEISRDGAFTEIELDLDGRKEKARIPSARLGPPRAAGDHDIEFDIVARKIDVDDVRVLGPCSPR